MTGNWNDRRFSWKAARLGFSCMGLMMFVAGCADEPAKAPVTVEQVIAMSKNGVDARTIIERMQDGGRVYRLSGSHLAALSADGVPDPVLNFMQQTYLRAERERQILAGCFCGLVACANEPAGPVKVEQVIAMSKNGVDEATIIARMQHAGGVYRLSGSHLAELKAAGVPNPVLDYMQQTYLRAERERQIVDGCSLGPPYVLVN